MFYLSISYLIYLTEGDSTFRTSPPSQSHTCTTRSWGDVVGVTPFCNGLCPI